MSRISRFIQSDATKSYKNAAAAKPSTPGYVYLFILVAQ
jgi:hypothetical protein